MARGVIKDHEGLRFDRLTVIRRSGIKGKQAAWLCMCDCGKFVTVAGHSLRSGNTKSCGCLSSEMALKKNMTEKRINALRSGGGNNFIDMSGMKIGRLTAMQPGPSKKSGCATWWCACECAEYKAPVLVLAKHLRAGKTQSCGCLRRERRAAKLQCDTPA